MALKMLGARIATLDTRRVKPPEKRADPFYLSPAWRALVRHLIKQRGRRCEECGRAGCRIFGDHIEELADGGAPLDPNNVKLRCGRCHTNKTLAKRAARLAK